MDDLISRQAAITALAYAKETGTMKCGELKGVIEVLNKVPSAQPETATVTIGRTKGDVTMWYECDACGEPIDICDCYCRKCGRKLKHE